MKATKITALATAAAGLGLILTVTAAPLFAQPDGPRGPRGSHAPHHGPGPGGGPLGGMMEDVVRFWDRPAAAEKLELTETQIELLEQSYEIAKPVVEENLKNMREAGRAIAEELRVEGEPDVTALNTAIDELTAAQNTAMKAAIAHRTTVQTLLLEEQLDTLHEMRRKHTHAAAQGPMREKIREMVKVVRTIAEDGVFADEERARVEKRLAEAPEPMRERVLAAIEKAVARVAAGEEVGSIEREFAPPSAREIPDLPPRGERRAGAPNRARSTK